MASTRPWSAVVVGMFVALVLGLGLGCGESGDDEGTTSSTSPDLVTTSLDVATTVAETITIADTTTVSGDVDISAQLVGVWDCVEMPGDYTIEFRADGTGKTCQQGEIGDIFTEFSYETDGCLVTLYYTDDMWQTLELSADGSVLAEEGPFGAFSLQRQ